MCEHYTFCTFSDFNNGVNVYTPFADVACLIKSAQAAPVADFASTTNVCNAAGTVILEQRLWNDD